MLLAGGHFELWASIGVESIAPKDALLAGQSASLLPELDEDDAPPSGGQAPAAPGPAKAKPASAAPPASGAGTSPGGGGAGTAPTCCAVA